MVTVASVVSLVVLATTADYSTAKAGALVSKLKHRYKTIGRHSVKKDGSRSARKEVVAV